MMLLLSLSSTLSLGCSTFPSYKGSAPNPVDPEVVSSLDSQYQAPLQNVQAELKVPFDVSWRVALDTFKNLGYPISEAIQEDGRIRTFDKEFNGPHYLWRESYSIRIAPVKNTHTLIKVRRSVKVYRRMLLLGPLVWMARSSNGQREKRLIEQIEQRLGNGVTENEK